MGFKRRELIRKTGVLTGLCTVSGKNFVRPDRKDESGYEEFIELINPENALVQEIAEDTGLAKFSSLTVNFPERVDFKPESDREVYGEDDYWASPSEYIENDFRGDCEDYSIFNTSLMLCKDIEVRTMLDIREKESHVATELKHDGDYWITDVRYPGNFYRRETLERELDWQPDRMVSEREIERYDPDW